jgi:hypothetical protein
MFQNLFGGANIGVMAGRTSGNLVCLDCDTLRAFEQTRQEIHRRALPHWGYNSHRGGGFLFRLLEGEAANAGNGKNLLPGVEVWGQAHYLVLPPSIHPQGTVYQWITPEPYYHLPAGEPIPAVSVDALEWAGVRLVKRAGSKWEEPALYGLPEWAGALSLANRQTLAAGVKKDVRNKKLTAAAYDMAGCDVPYDVAECMLIDAAGRCSPPYPRREVEAIIKSAYKKERQPARKAAAFIPQNWQRAAAFALAFDWREYGRTAQTVRAVFLACVERARLDGSPTFRASAREVAELANVKADTANRHLRMLTQEAGGPALLRHCGTSDTTGANLYAFTEDVLKAEPGSAPDGDSNYTLQYVVSPLCAPEKTLKDGTPRTAAEQDVFARLGKVAWRVWRRLCSKPEPTGAAVARVEGLNPSSTRRALAVLLRHGLVVHSKAEGLFVGEPRTQKELERLSAALDTLGKSEKRKRKHERERERRLNLLMMQERERWYQIYLQYNTNMQQELTTRRMVNHGKK